VKCQAPHEPTSPRDGITRLAPLDVLRCTAVLLILFRHLYVCPNKVNSVVHGMTVTILRGSWIGVDLFFVLSGFLIAGLLFREAQARGAFPSNASSFAEDSRFTRLFGFSPLSASLWT